MDLKKTVKVGATEYTLTFPQTGREQVAIMTNQSEYSDGKYLDILKLDTNASFYQWQLINTASLLDVIAPTIAKDMNGGVDISIMDLPVAKSNQLVHIYNNELDAWYRECEEEAFKDGQ